MPVKRPESSTEMSYKYEIGDSVQIIGTEPSGYTGTPHFVDGMEKGIGMVGEVVTRNYKDIIPIYEVQIRNDKIYSCWSYAEVWLVPAVTIAKDSWNKLMGDG